MALRAIFSGSQQILEEVCEHCGEKIRDIHVSEIAIKPSNDPRTIRIRDVNNNAFEVKEKRERITEVTASYIRKNLLDDTEARAAFRNETLKYGIRAEAMCSESIDIDNAVTQSFCYRVEATPDDRRFQKVVGGRTLSASLALAEKSDTTGSRMGVDRKGNVIKMNRYKNLNLSKKINEEDTEKDTRGAEVTRKKGAFETPWFEDLSDDDKRRVIESSQSCERLIDTYGEEVKTMKVVARVRSLEEYARLLDAMRCRL